MINLTGLPKVPMRIIFMTMFVLVTWAAIGNGWLGLSYILSNYMVVMLGIWAEHEHTSPVPVQMFFFGTLFTLLNDVISVGIAFRVAQIQFEHAGALNLFNFNASCVVILILCKPVAALFIYREWNVRVSGGEPDNMAQPGSSNYERLGNDSVPQGGYAPSYGAYGSQDGYGVKSEPAPQYQPPTQPFP